MGVACFVLVTGRDEDVGLPGEVEQGVEVCGLFSAFEIEQHAGVIEELHYLAFWVTDIFDVKTGQGEKEAQSGRVAGARKIVMAVNTAREKAGLIL